MTDITCKQLCEEYKKIIPECERKTWARLKARGIPDNAIAEHINLLSTTINDFMLIFEDAVKNMEPGTARFLRKRNTIGIRDDE